MTPVYRLLGLVLLAALPFQVALAKEKQTLEGLLAANQNLVVQLANATKVQGDIAKAERAVSGADAVIKRADRELQQKGVGIVQSMQDVNTRAAQSGCPWNTQHEDKAFVDGCNETGRRLTAELEALRKQGASVADLKRKLDQEHAEISKRTMTLFAQKKRNNSDLEKLGAAREDWNNRYREFLFQSETYERLKKTAPGSWNCEGMDLISAGQCLQRIWDGANR